MTEEVKVIGRGYWLDKVAYEIVKREEKLGRDLSLIRTESGLGASGIPHVGSMADAVRAYGVKLALENLGYRAESIAFSDDMDGLRKVPAGLPSWLEDYLLHPVSRIPDPFGCHGSYGEHMSSMLRDALDEAGVEYTFMSGTEAYKKGLLVEQIHKILLNAKLVGEKIKEILGQEKFLTALPYFPVCKSCGRIYTARAISYDPKRRRVKYVCEGAEVKGRFYEGCGYEGEADITRDDGKLAWKVEFAARWAALDIRFEAYGKDIADSVKVNDWVCEHVLGFAPPLHIQYELFLDASGRKISKSVGNVLTPQVWYKYGPPESLLLLIYKRYVGTRIVDVATIPRLVDELDYLEDVYFGRVKLTNKMEEIKLKALYEYVHHLEPPSKPSVHVPYSLIVDIASVAPPDGPDFVLKRLEKYGYKNLDGRALDKVRRAINFARDFKKVEPKKVELSEAERAAVADLIKEIEAAPDARTLQNRIFEAARAHGIEPSAFFSKLYEILLGTRSGPRLGPLIFEYGKERVIARLREVVAEEQQAGEHGP